MLSAEREAALEGGVRARHARHIPVALAHAADLLPERLEEVLARAGALTERRHDVVHGARAAGDVRLHALELAVELGGAALGELPARPRQRAQRHEHEKVGALLRAGTGGGGGGRVERGVDEAVEEREEVERGDHVAVDQLPGEAHHHLNLKRVARLERRLKLLAQ